MAITTYHVCGYVNDGLCFEGEKYGDAWHYSNWEVRSNMVEAAGYLTAKPAYGADDTLTTSWAFPVDSGGVVGNAVEYIGPFATLAAMQDYILFAVELPDTPTGSLVSPSVGYYYTSNGQPFDLPCVENLPTPWSDIWALPPAYVAVSSIAVLPFEVC